MTAADELEEKLDTSEKDQPGGYAGLTDEGHLVGPIIARHDTAEVMDGIVLDEGELGYKTDTQDLLVGDGEAAGGLYANRYDHGAAIFDQTNDPPQQDYLILTPSA